MRAPSISANAPTGGLRRSIDQTPARVTPARAKKIVPRIRAGAVFVNAGGLAFDMPFGGYKQSGNGREFGKFGLEEFLEVKSVIGALPEDEDIAA